MIMEHSELKASLSYIVKPNKQSKTDKKWSNIPPQEGKKKEKIIAMYQ